MKRCLSKKRSITMCLSENGNNGGDLSDFDQPPPPAAKKTKRYTTSSSVTIVGKKGITIPAPESVGLNKCSTSEQHVSEPLKRTNLIPLDLNCSFIQECFEDSGKGINGVNLLSVEELEDYVSILRKHQVLPKGRCLTKQQCLLLPPMNDFYRVLSILNKLVTKADAISMLKKRKEGTTYVFGSIGSSFSFSFPKQEQQQQQQQQQQQNSPEEQETKKRKQN